MTRTGVGAVVGFGLVGVIIGYLLELLAAATGSAIIVPPLSLPVALIAIAAIVLAFAVQIRRAVRGRSSAKIDPFRSMRVAVLAKASSLAGAVLTGLGIGIILYLLSRSAQPALGSLWLAIAAAAGAGILLAAGLVSEYFCTIPPRDDDDEPKDVRV